MDEAPKKTAGQIIQEFNEKEHAPITPYELAKEGQLKDYDKNLEICIAHHAPLYGKDFYIEKRVQHEWPLGGAPLPVMKARASCPTPTPLQTVIKYHYKEQAIEYLWTLPAKWQFRKYKVSPLLLSTEERKTLQDILEFEDGTLLIKAKKLNGEPLNHSKSTIDFLSKYKAIS